MRPDPVIEFCLGLGAIVLALVVALLLAFPPAWLDSRQAAYANFRDVSHLGEGATVTENGYVRGTVVRIEPVGSWFRVHMKVQPGFRLASGWGLAVEEANPLQAANLVVAHQCRLVAGAPVPSGCCPESLAPAGAAPEEQGLASCGRLPNLIDVALQTTLMAKGQIGDLSDYVRKTVPPLLERTGLAVGATIGGMTAMKAASENGSKLMNDNAGKLKSTIDSASDTLASLKKTTRTIDDLLDAKRDQLDASLTNVSGVLATTAASMPGIVDNLQKSAEDMRAITGQIRNEPTSLIRRRDRSDPSFVDPAPEK